MNFKNKITKFAILLLAVALLSSCDEDGFCIKGKGGTETRVLELDDLDQVKVNGSSKVYIRQGAQQHIEVKGEPNILDVLNMNVKDGKWTVETTRCVRKHKTLEVFITVPSVEHVEINGSGRIELQDTFEEPEVRLLVNGSGEISAAYVTGNAISSVNGSGDIYLNGSTNTQSVSITGSGKVKAFDFSAENTTVNISGSGNVEVKASQALDVTISGSGKVKYKGNPATLSTSISGSGKVEKS